MDKLFAVVGVAVVAVLFLSLFAVLGGTFVYWLWPSTAVAVFSLPALTWWQAVKLTWLCSFLFKSSNMPTKTEKD